MADTTSQRRFRVGVVGLGRLWEVRHRPALERLKSRYAVTAVYDQVPVRAEREARQLGCAASPSLSGLIGRDDVDILFLLTPQWFGLHALSLACEAGKPVYCALPLGSESPEDLASIDAAVRSKGLTVIPEFARRFYPASLRLRELIATKIGRPRLMIGQSRLAGFDRYGSPGPSSQMAPSPLLVDPGTYLLDWCRFIFQEEPTRVQGIGAHVSSQPVGGDQDYEDFVAEFPGGGLAQMGMLRYDRPAWGEATRFLPTPGIQVFAERGAAWLELPETIQWSDVEGLHEEKLPKEPAIGEVLCTQLHRALCGEPSLVPKWEDAMAVARLVRSIQRSESEGRRIGLES